jgi:hypothetical protein
LLEGGGNIAANQARGARRTWEGIQNVFAEGGEAAKEIAGYEMEEHAQDRQEEDGIADADVEAALEDGVSYDSKIAGRVVHYDPISNTTVVTQGKIIKTIRRGKPSRIEPPNAEPYER